MPTDEAVLAELRQANARHAAGYQQRLAAEIVAMLPADREEAELVLRFARAFTETSRRREVLSFSHHIEVAALPLAEASPRCSRRPPPCRRSMKPRPPACALVASSVKLSRSSRPIQ